MEASRIGENTPLLIQQNDSPSKANPASTGDRVWAVVANIFTLGIYSAYNYHKVIGAMERGDTAEFVQRSNWRPVRSNLLYDATVSRRIQSGRYHTVSAYYDIHPQQAVVNDQIRRVLDSINIDAFRQAVWNGDRSVVSKMLKDGVISRSLLQKKFVYDMTPLDFSQMRVRLSPDKRPQYARIISAISRNLDNPDIGERWEGARAIARMIESE